jgi:cephalosporin hydroxylase
MGRPIIQFPQDMLALQEIVWRVKPEVIVETGIAHGGSLVYSASLLALLGGDRFVVGVDVDIRAHNRREIEAHPMAARIRMIQGSSVDDTVASAVRDHCLGKRSVLVILDSNHTHAHVLRELQLYGPLVTTGSYLIVLDTLIEDMPAEFFAGRAWGKGNNPKTAVHEFLAGTKRFEIDAAIPAKLLLTTAPDGYLRCVGD